MKRKEEELEIDVSKLSEEEKKEMGYHFPLAWAIALGVLAVLIVICIIVILVIK